jgi:hypothetical protein
LFWVDEHAAVSAVTQLNGSDVLINDDYVYEMDLADDDDACRKQIAMVRICPLYGRLSSMERHDDVLN